MNYDKELHIPQQIELLLQHRADANIKGFGYILDGVKIIMKDHPVLLDGLKTDETTQTKNIEKAANNSREMILKAFNTSSGLVACQTTNQILTQLETIYNNIMLEYMNDVIQTCVSYKNETNGTDQEPV